MTEMLFRADPYVREATTRVKGLTPEGGVILESSLFYPQGGGQPGDSGRLSWDGGVLDVATTVKGDDNAIVLIAAGGDPRPATGAEVHQRLDWDRRYGHMRVHTALHLLSVVIPLPVTGGAIGSAKGRLDFDMPDVLEDKEAVEAALQSLIDRDLPVAETWISDDELDANPALVKTMSVRPPTGQGRVRLIRIGREDDQVDLQPCGGTHVASTGEIGRIAIGKVEKKGARNRRVTLRLAD